MAIYKLKDLGEFKGGISTLDKTKYDTGILFINYKDIFNNISIKEKSKIRLYDATENDIRKYNVQYGDLLFTASSETPEEIAMSSVYMLNEDAIFNGFSKRYRYDQEILKPKYASYLFRAIDFRGIASSLASGYTRYNISQKSLENIEVSIPMKDEQQKIIDIIEQKEELFIKYSNTIRIDTYNHCKHDMIKLIDIIEPIERIIQNIIFQNEKIDQIILSFDPKGNISKCSDIANIKTGKRNANHSRTNGKYNFYTCSDRVMKCDEYSFDSESLLVAGNGNVGNVKYFNGKFDAYQRTYVITFKEFIGTAYLSFLKNQKILSNSSQGSVIKYLVLKDIQNIEVVLDQEVNKKIVDLLRIKLINEKMLSNFENLLNTTIKKMIV